MTRLNIDTMKEHIGGIVQLSKEELTDDTVVEAIRTALEDRAVLIFPQLNLSDEEQRAFTDRLRRRINIASNVPESEGAGVEMSALERTMKTEPDYSLITHFWHVDGLMGDRPLQKVHLISARALSGPGDAMEFANQFAAYDLLSEKDKTAMTGRQVIHTMEASLRCAYGQLPPDRLARWESIAPPRECPLIWTHEDNRKSLLLGAHADNVVGWSLLDGRAALVRTLQYATQPDITCIRRLQLGDLIVWNNVGVMTRTTPKKSEPRTFFHTKIIGREHPGREASADALEAMRRPLL